MRSEKKTDHNRYFHIEVSGVSEKFFQCCFQDLAQTYNFFPKKLMYQKIIFDLISQKLYGNVRVAQNYYSNYMFLFSTLSSCKERCKNKNLFLRCV